MNPREWFLLGLRLLAIALFVLVAMQTVPLLFLMGRGDFPEYFWISLANPAAIAVLLLLFAPSFANRLYGRSRSTGEGSGAVAPASDPSADVFAVGRRLVGLYALYQAVHPLTRILTLQLGGSQFRLRDFSDWGGPVVEAAGYLLFGIVLLVGPARIWRGLNALRFSAPGPRDGGGGAPGA